MALQSVSTIHRTCNDCSELRWVQSSIQWTIRRQQTHRDQGEKLRQWQLAPAAGDAHPREEHLLPLMVAAGAAGHDLGRKIFTDQIMSATISAFGFGMPH